MYIILILIYIYIYINNITMIYYAIMHCKLQTPMNGNKKAMSKTPNPPPTRHRKTPEPRCLTLVIFALLG